MDKINFQDLPSTETPINSSNLNKMQDNVENAINEVEERVVDLEGKTSGMYKVYTTIKAGEYYQIPFSTTCGLCFLRTFAPNHEYFKIFAVMLSNKFASKINEIQSYHFNNNTNVIISFEIIDGEEDDFNKYIRVINSGSVEVGLHYGVLNMI